MPSHKETRIVPWLAEQLFDLVMDIESYPQFLPWCVGARVLERGADTVEADVLIGYGPFREKFSSRVRYVRPSRIEVEYKKGPMRHLHNKWSFRDVKAGQCSVSFFVDFSMQSHLLEKVAEQFFHRALTRMINAFEVRALDLYGGERH